MSLAATAPPAQSKLVHPNPNGRLVYTPDARGNTIPYYSYAGYMGGGVALPNVPVKATLKPMPGVAGSGPNDTPRIQAAIDQVSKLPPDANGIRGAVLLGRGEYYLPSPLTISAGGVVLRGEGSGENGTVLRAIMHKKAKLITIAGSGERKQQGKIAVADDVVPVGALSFALESVSGLKVGDPVLVVRNTNEAWVSAVGMDKIPGRPGQEESTRMWKPGPREFYDRTITKIERNRVTLDAPVYNDIRKEYGGGWVSKYSFPGRIAQCGVENLRAVSVWERKPGQGKADGKGLKTADDLLHADNFVVIDNAQDCWVSDCACVDFLQGGVWVERNGRRVTIRDCQYFVPDPKNNDYVDEPHGETSRYSFSFSGQQNLAIRCYGKFGRHTFMTQSQVAGPNVFLDCNAEKQHSVSETHHRWATGVLFDGIGRTSPTSLQSVNRQWMGSGHGWSGAYVTMWNCVGNPIICEVPPTASNWAVGCSGERDHGPFNKNIDDAAYDSWGKAVEPLSLYRAQLRDRLGPSAVENLDRRKQIATVK